MWLLCIYYTLSVFFCIYIDRFWWFLNYLEGNAHDVLYLMFMSELSGKRLDGCIVIGSVS